MKVSKSIIAAIAVGLAINHAEAQTVKKPKTTSNTVVPPKNVVKNPKATSATKPTTKDSLTRKRPTHEPEWCPPCGKG
jgi:hypothetical protein